MPDERPTFGSLFAGIGGIDLGLERAGWRGRWQVEYEPFCQRVLAKHWPDVTRYGDIHDVDWESVERVDLVAGGFPCQPVSVAGRGLAQDDARWLWPEFLRAVRALRPRYVLVENVPGLLQRGLGIVLGDLAASGYDAEWDCVPAAAVGAPHLRDRVWIVAYASGARRRQDAGGAHAHEGQHAGRSQVHADELDRDGEGGRARPMAFSDGAGLPLSGQESVRTNGRTAGRGVAASGWWAIEPDVGRVAHGVPSRVDRLRALGNAVVPQVVEAIGLDLLDARRGGG